MGGGRKLVEGKGVKGKAGKDIRRREVRRTQDSSKEEKTSVSSDETNKNLWG